eukprot:g13852.t1
MEIDEQTSRSLRASHGPQDKTASSPAAAATAAAPLTSTAITPAATAASPLTFNTAAPAATAAAAPLAFNPTPTANAAAASVTFNTAALAAAAPLTFNTAPTAATGAAAAALLASNATADAAPAAPAAAAASSSSGFGGFKIDSTATDSGTKPVGQSKRTLLDPSQPGQQGFATASTPHSAEKSIEQVKKWLRGVFSQGRRPLPSSKIDQMMDGFKSDTELLEFAKTVVGRELRALEKSGRSATPQAARTKEIEQLVNSRESLQAAKKRQPRPCAVTVARHTGTLVYTEGGRPISWLSYNVCIGGTWEVEDGNRSIAR